MSAPINYYDFNISSFYYISKRREYNGNENTLKFKGSENYNTLSLNSTIPVGVFDTDESTPNYKILSNPLYKYYELDELLGLIEEVYEKYNILNSKTDIILRTKCAYYKSDKLEIKLNLESFFFGNNITKYNIDIISSESAFDVDINYYIDVNYNRSSEIFIINNRLKSPYSFEECTKIITYFINKYNDQEYNHSMSLYQTNEYITELIKLQSKEKELKAQKQLDYFCVYCDKDFTEEDIDIHLKTDEKCSSIERYRATYSNNLDCNINNIDIDTDGIDTDKI
jgi:hypothetical protein